MGADLAFVRAGKANFDRADLTATNLEKALLKGASFRNARLIHTDLLEAKFFEANLEGAVMEAPRIRFAVFQDAWMKDCAGCPVNWQTGETVWQTEEKERKRNEN
jgi:uncharacterized protein YjbI with pentapeptide repeats